jgi:hypothetical protein
MEKNRTERSILLNQLIARERPLAGLLRDLASFGWDLEERLAILTREDVSRILSGFLTHDISAKDVEEWANALEIREDVGLEHGYAELLKEVIFELANPLLTDPITHDRVKRWIERLETAPEDSESQ